MRGLESRKVENSRKVNYSWEKKSLQFFLLIYAWSFFYPALCPSPCSLLCSACSHQPLISISQPLQQQASRVGCSLFILYFLQQCRKRTKEKNVLNLKRTLAQGSCAEKTPTKQFEGKSSSVPAHIFGAHTQKCTSVLGVKIKGVWHKQCTELGKSTNTTARRPLYPHPCQEGISQLTFICHRPLSREQDPSALSCRGGRYGNGKGREAFLRRQGGATGTEQVMGQCPQQVPDERLTSKPAVFQHSPNYTMQACLFHKLSSLASFPESRYFHCH